MGIHDLTKLLSDSAPEAIKETTLQDFVGRKIAVDASMAIYQFLVAVRSSDGTGPAVVLTDASGEVTSHLQGMFNRTIRFMEAGMKPVYVFDGKPPESKSEELARRRAIKERAEEDLKEATEAGNTEDIERYSKRTVRMTSQHQEECKKLLRLMGVPVIEAPGEADAQCAILAKSGKVYAAASEDMDTLVFGTPVLLRRLTFSDARKLPVLEFKLEKALAGLGLTMAQFIDLCILCGCDYCGDIKGVGPKTALKWIQTHGTLEATLAAMDKTRFTIPDNFDYVEARRLFTAPDIQDPAEIDLKWTPCDTEGLTKFLVEEKGFAAERVARGIEKLNKAKGAALQQRMENFFGAPIPSPAAGGGGAAAAKKRPNPVGAKAGAKKAMRK